MLRLVSAAALVAVVTFGPITMHSAALAAPAHVTQHVTWQQASDSTTTGSQVAVQAVTAQQVPDQLAQAIASIWQLLVLGIGAIGVTGGLQGLLGNLPDITIGPWTIKGGIVLLSVVAVAGVGLSDVLGWLPPPSAFATVQAWALAQWGAIVATATLLYGMGGFAVDHAARKAASLAGTDPNRA